VNAGLSLLMAPSVATLFGVFVALLVIGLRIPLAIPRAGSH
jgi:hypothetical protein